MHGGSAENIFIWWLVNRGGRCKETGGQRRWTEGSNNPRIKKKKKKVVGRSEVVEMDVKRTTASHRKSVAQTEGGGGEGGIPHWDVCHCFAR